MNIGISIIWQDQYYCKELITSIGGYMVKQFKYALFSQGGQWLKVKADCVSSWAWITRAPVLEYSIYYIGILGLLKNLLGEWI